MKRVLRNTKGFLRQVDRYGIGFLVYLGVAVCSALLEWLSFAISLLIMTPVPASLVGFVVATAANYFLSRRFAFISKRTVTGELVLTFVSSAVAFLGNFLTFYSLYSQFDLNPFVAKLVGTGAGFVFNYFVRQFLIFSADTPFVPVSNLLQGPAEQSYTGTRILEAMHSGIRYGHAIFDQIAIHLPVRDSRILDFGAGAGFFAEKFQEIGINVVCVEPDSSLRQDLAGKGIPVHASTNDIAANTFDFIYTINVLEHIGELEQACAELFRILRPGGKLFVFVPAFNILWTSLDNEVGHVQRFRRDSLGSVLRMAEFDVEKIRYFDSLGFPAAFAVRILEKFGLFRYNSSSVGFYDRCIFPLSERLDRFTSSFVGKNIIAIASKNAA